MEPRTASRPLSLARKLRTETMAFVPALPSSTIGRSALTGVSVCETKPLQYARDGGVAVRTPMQMKKSRFHQPVRPQRPGELPIPEDGTPIFSLFVRSTRSKIWFPLGSMEGDDRSKSLVNGLKSSIGKGLCQNSLDKGIAQTVFGRDKDRLMGTVIRQYPQLKKNRNLLEFGYKISAKGLDDMPTRLVKEDMALNFFGWAKQKVDNALSGGK